MTKHRTITGFVAIALLTIAATVANIRTHGPLTDGIVVSSGTTKGLTVDANTSTASFDERWSAIAASKTDTPEQ
jgi:hypothetical protein